MPELEIPEGFGTAATIGLATDRCNAVLESVIRAHPEQWVWGHRRFRDSPDLAVDPYKLPRSARTGRWSKR